MKELQLPSGRTVLIRPITMKSFRKFLKIVSNRGLTTNDVSDADMINMLVDDFIPVVAEAIGQPEDKINEMDPRDYMQLAKNVMEEYSGFLANMGE